MEEMKSHPMTMSEKLEAADEVRIKAEEDFRGAMDYVDSEKKTDKYENQKSPMNSEVYGLKISQSNKDVCSLMRCRLCAIPNNVMVDISSSDVITKNILEKIEYCLCIVVKESDPLPKQVCWLCLGKLEMCYDFNQAVAEAESQLLAYCQQTTDDEVKETDSSRCGAQHDATEYDRIEGTLGNCSDPDIDYESTTVPEKVATTDIIVKSSFAWACLKPCSVVLVPTDIYTRNNINNDGKGSSSDDELLDADSSTGISNSAKTLVSQNDPQSTCGLSQAKSDSESQATEKFLGTDGGTEFEDTKNGSSNDPAEIGQPRHSIAKRKRHRRSHFVDRKYKCSVCGKKLRSKTNIYYHHLIHSGDRRFKCCICGKKFFTKAHKDRHHLSHTREKRVEFSSRPKSSEMISGMHREKRFENMKKSPIDAPADIEHRPYKCNSCAKTYKFERNLAAHKKIHTSIGLHSCDYCEKKFVSNAERNRHHRIHTGERPFGCTICDKKFITRSHRDSHYLIHTGERPFGCTICDKKFTSKRNRDKHHLTHTREKPNKFPSKPPTPDKISGIMDHGNGFENMKKSPIDAPADIGHRLYKCNSCAKTFKRKKYLALHEKIHTRIGLHSCEYCEKEFVTKTERNRHHRSHTGERPFECCICGNKFYRKGHRDQHHLTHTREKPNKFPSKPPTPDKISGMDHGNGIDNMKNTPTDARSLQVELLCKDVRV